MRLRDTEIPEVLRHLVPGPWGKCDALSEERGEEPEASGPLGPPLLLAGVWALALIGEL